MLNKRRKKNSGVKMYARLKPYNPKRGQPHQSITLSRIGMTFHQGTWMEIPSSLAPYLKEQFGDYEPYAPLYEVGTKEQCKEIIIQHRKEEEARKKRSKKSDPRKDRSVSSSGTSIGREVSEAFFESDMGEDDSPESIWDQVSSEMEELGVKEETTETLEDFEEQDLHSEPAAFEESIEEVSSESEEPVQGESEVKEEPSPQEEEQEAQEEAVPEVKEKAKESKPKARRRGSKKSS